MLSENSTQLRIAVNAGSSSLKVAVYSAGEAASVCRGRLTGIGTASCAGSAATPFGAPQPPGMTALPADTSPTTWLVRWLATTVGSQPDCRFGHRVVASRRSPAVEPVTATLLADLKRATEDDPIHLPAQIALIEAIAAARPGAPQFACSDSAFHATIALAGRKLPIPREFDALGIERYGFHGLSCASVMRTIHRSLGAESAAARVVIAHLGSGASVTAVREGRSVDTSMGFSPDGGLMMATRSGDLDPGVMLALLKRAKLTPDRLAQVIAAESGLRGRAGDTGDLSVLLERSVHDPDANEAVEMFCRLAARGIGAAATTAGGIDILVFTGGVGEHLAEIRARICRNLRFLGIALNPVANRANAGRIGARDAPVVVLVVATDEEGMIAELISPAPESPA